MHQKQTVENEIDKLQPFVIVSGSYRITIHLSLYLTLIDGKVLNIITNTRSIQSCPICHETPKNFNNLSNKKPGYFTSNSESLRYGISSLHAWIRFLDCCLHISYKLTIKKWQIIGDENKKKMGDRKSYIQKVMWENFGLRVDKPKAGGSGNTNDGNTARRAFRNPKLFANSLGLNQELIQNFQTILIALSCQLPIDATEFENLCISTAKIYVLHYNWYPMPSTVHKILINGGEIIKNSVLPVGMLGEEASESRNKDYRVYRRYHGRKNSQLNNLEDLFNRAMDSTDPIASTMSIGSRLRMKKHLTLLKAVRKLLSVSEVTNVSQIDLELESDTEEESPDEYEELSKTQNRLDDIELSGEEW